MICWLPPTSPWKRNRSHRLNNRAAPEEFARFSTLLTRDRGGTASTNNFTGQMTLLESDPAGTASTNSFTKQMTLPLGGTASSSSFTEYASKNATNLTTGDQCATGQVPRGFMPN